MYTVVKNRHKQHNNKQEAIRNVTTTTTTTTTTRVTLPCLEDRKKTLHSKPVARRTWRGLKRWLNPTCGVMNQDPTLKPPHSRLFDHLDPHQPRRPHESPRNAGDSDILRRTHHMEVERHPVCNGKNSFLEATMPSTSMLVSQSVVQDGTWLD